ncbi:MAG: hypothetical protein QM767_22230 [Anaeromyxobacter sp.]
MKDTGSDRWTRHYGRVNLAWKYPELNDYRDPDTEPEVVSAKARWCGVYGYDVQASEAVLGDLCKPAPFTSEASIAGMVNGPTKGVMGLAKMAYGNFRLNWYGIKATFAPLTEGRLPDRLDYSDAVRKSYEPTADWWNGEFMSYTNTPAARTNAFVGEVLSPGNLLLGEGIGVGFRLLGRLGAAGDGIGVVAGNLRGPVAGAADAAEALSQLEHPLTGWSPDQVVNHAMGLGVKTPRDSLWLWSGLRNGVQESQTFARTYGGMTLEMTPGGRWLNDMKLWGAESPFTPVEASSIWNRVSRGACEQASGQVRAVLGQVSPRGAFMSEEMPTVLANPKVTGLDPFYVPPNTYRAPVLFDPSNPLRGL